MNRSIIANEYIISVTEVLDILKYLPGDIVSKIPAKFMKFLEENSIPSYKPKFDYSHGLDKVAFSDKTKALLAMIYREYICSKEEQVRYDKILRQNEELYQINSRKKYNTDNIFSNNKKLEKENQNKQLVEYKQFKWYEKIIQNILRFFK